MRALTVLPTVPDSAEVSELDEPAESEGSVLVEVMAVGVCGTDQEIIAGEYGEAPPGQERLVLGHESIGRVVSAPAGGDLSEGDLVVGIVREPDPVPCRACAAGEWDMCLNGEYTEHGIKGVHGFARERYRAEPERLVRVDAALGDLGVLLEPASVLAKAWDHIDRIGGRSTFAPENVLVTGAGPIGLLAALLGVQRGLNVHVLDLADSGPKPGLVRDLGATYHAADSVVDLGFRPDLAIECTGAASLVIELFSHTAVNGITCLTGVSSPGGHRTIDAGAVNRDIVLENDVIFGSVNANRRHYDAGAAALGQADREWLSRLVTRAVPLADYRDALNKQPGDVKVTLRLDA